MHQIYLYIYLSIYPSLYINISTRTPTNARSHICTHTRTRTLIEKPLSWPKTMCVSVPLMWRSTALWPASSRSMGTPPSSPSPPARRPLGTWKSTPGHDKQRWGDEDGVDVWNARGLRFILNRVDWIWWTLDSIGWMSLVGRGCGLYACWWVRSCDTCSSYIEMYIAVITPCRPWYSSAMAWLVQTLEWSGLIMYVYMSQAPIHSFTLTHQPTYPYPP